MKIAYLVSKYPFPSFTFIHREIKELRDLNLDIYTFSIHRPSDSEIISEVNKEEMANTWYVLPTSPFNLLLNNLKMFLRRPQKYLKTLILTINHRQPGTKRLLWSFFYFLEAMLIAEKIEILKIHHLHNCFANTAANVGLAVSRYLGINWSFTLHGLGDFDDSTNFYEKVAAASFVACATQYGLAQAMRMVDPSQWKKLCVIRCGVELDNILQYQQIREAKPEKFKIISVGRFSPEKGYVGLIESFAIALEKGLDAELILIGNGPEEKNIKNIVNFKHLEKRVNFLGWKSEEEVFDQMLKSDFFVLSSFLEGLPVVLMEAMALKLPVIAPIINGIPELVTHRKTGLCFIAGNWLELSDRILELAQKPDLRIQLANIAYSKIIEEFDIKKNVQPLCTKFLSISNNINND